MNEEPSEEESLKKTKKLLLKWKNDKNIQELKEFYDTKSFSDILGVERREMSHSNFIAWILNDKESHHLGQFAIKQLLDILLEYGEEKIKNSLDKYNEINEEKLQFGSLYKALMLNNYIIENLEIGVEKVLTKGRIDIIVSMMIRSNKDDIELPKKVNIIIENKVDSSEHSSQTTTYYSYYTTDDKYKNDLNLFVFLLPVSTSKLFEPLAECEHFINVNYQLLADNVFERALNHDISDRVKFMIIEYLLSLRKPSKKGTIMAIGKLEEELLKDFWNQHRDLIEAVADATLLSSNSSDEENEIANDISSSIKRAKVRHNNIDDYVKSELKTIDSENIKRLKILIKAIESKFDDTIDITYAPSRINIKNPNSKGRGKVFVYIHVMKNIIRLDIMIPIIRIELSNENEIKNEKDDYMNKLKTAFESLEN